MTCAVCSGPPCACAADGALLAGRYRVQRPLGEGSRKRVLLVTDTWLDRQVTLSLLRSDDPGEAARLRREAALTAGFDASQGVVGVHDVGQVGDRPFVVTQYLEGGSVRDLLTGGRVPLPRALALARDLALALADLHARRLVHRDVAPENIWLTAEGRAVLGDLGLAAFEEDRTVEPQAVVGTLAYVAPEQALGAPPDRRADLYSLGVVLWELLVGRPPLPAPGLPSFLSLQRGQGHEAPSRHRPGVPGALDALVLRLLAADPADRPPDAADVAGALDAMLGPPPEADPQERSLFVGREPELDVLRTALADADRGQGGLVLLLGEPGIGKTRLSAELARDASRTGAMVLSGRCPDGEGAPAYWPWIQVLRAAVEQLGKDTLRELLGWDADLLEALLASSAAEGSGLDGEDARFRLFDTVSRVLHGIAGTGLVLVVLDDVHWADLASLALLRHAAREAAGNRLLLVACARELTSPLPDLAAALGALSTPAARTLTLRGLPLGAAEQLVSGLSGLSLAAPSIRTLHDRTEGNPFFLSELVHLLLAEHRLQGPAALPVDAGVPGGVRELLLRRLEQVGPGCVTLLRTCAVLGREVPLDLLARVSGRTGPELLPLLHEAVGQRLLVPLPGVRAAHRFPHALVQEVLYDSIGPLERAQLHLLAGRALLDLRADELEERAAELAGHFVRAADAGSPRLAVQWSIRAARVAEAAGGWEEAVAHYEKARHLAEGLPAGEDRPPPGELLLALGEAQCRAGRADESRATFSRAAELALLLGEPELLARAALGTGNGLGGFGFAERADGELLALLEESLAMLDEQDSALRVRVLARLSTELYFTPFQSRRLELSTQALEMAVRLGDRRVELVARYSRTWALLGPDGLEERRTSAERVLRLARSLEDADMVFRAHHLRINIWLESGQLEQAEAEIDSCRRLAALTRHPVHRWQVAVWDAMRALLEGNVREADRLKDEALRLGRRGHADMAMVVYGAQTMVTRWAQGQLHEVVAAARSFADRYPHAPAWRAALAYIYTETDRPEAAQAELDVLAARDFADLPRDGNFLTAATFAAMTAARVSDVARCGQLLALLDPYADRYVVIAAGAVAFTSVELPLAMLCRALGQWDRARQHLQQASRRHQQRGARGLEVLTAHEQVTTLLRTGQPADRIAAEQVAAGATRLADSLDMPRHATLLRASAPAPGAPVTLLLTDIAGSTALTERLGEELGFRLLGDHRKLAEDLASRHRGTALKSLGDGVLLAFPDAADALRCAAQLQLRAGDSGTGLRLGVHTGAVLREGASMYGRTMVLAFRIAARARAGEVLLSVDTRTAVSNAAGLAFDRGCRMRLKGFAEPVLVHRLLWQQLPAVSLSGS